MPAWRGSRQRRRDRLSPGGSVRQEKPRGHKLTTVQNWLTIRAADGLEFPYLGYFEADIVLAGITVCNRGVLVVRDVLSAVPQVISCLRDLGQRDKLQEKSDAISSKTSETVKDLGFYFAYTFLRVPSVCTRNLNFIDTFLSRLGSFRA